MSKPSVATQRLIGGALCLDFANTVDWTPDGSERTAQTDVLVDPADLADWGRRLGVAAGEVSVTAAELAAAKQLRSAIHDLFSAAARAEAPARQAVEVLERAHAEAVAAATLDPRDAWSFGWAQDDPRRVRFAVAVDAVDLLRGGHVERVRVCPGRDCGWLFLDRSGRRRWCSMETCGSRAKMRRLYERRRAG